MMMLYAMVCLGWRVVLRIIHRQVLAHFVLPSRS